MRKYIAFLFALVCVLGLAGCHQPAKQQVDPHTQPLSPASEMDVEADAPPISIPDFSYAEESAIYAESSPGIKASGFVNTSETKLTLENVAEHAKNECTVEYDSVSTYLDAVECVWKVHFYNSEMLGGDQTVYLDHDGKTLLIVYGE